MARLLIFVGVLGICAAATFTSTRAATPIFYTSLDDETNSITNNNGGSTPGDNFAFVSGPGITGNAFQSTNSGTNNGGWARWNNTAVGNIFSTWNDANGITIDHYFGGSAITSTPSNISEGLWALVKRSNVTGDQYFFTSLRGGKLRIAFANNSADQYKYSFDGSAANPGGDEFAPGVDFTLANDTPYHLTVSVGNGAFKVWLDDLNGNLYSNETPIFSDVNFNLPEGYNWTLPNADTVSQSGAQTGRQNREMDIGIRGFGNTGNTINNFGSTIREFTWIDEVKVYNGVYTPAELATPGPIPGDYNGDQQVSAADYNLWRKHFPNNSGLATLAMGDGNGDGNVTSADYDVWRTHFGNIAGSGTGSGLGGGAVPEPSAALLAICAGLAFAMRRQQSPARR